MLNPRRILAVTLAASGFLLAPLALVSHAGETAARGADRAMRAKSMEPADGGPGQAPARPAAPKPSDSPKADPRRPDGEKGEPASQPGEEEEVAPGEDPASCDGCELAGLVWAGSLWGLFAVERVRRGGIPRAFIRGQPRH